jgi:hypothetical protein
VIGTTFNKTGRPGTVATWRQIRKYLLTAYGLARDIELSFELVAAMPLVAA